MNWRIFIHLRMKIHSNLLVEIPHLEESIIFFHKSLSYKVLKGGDDDLPNGISLGVWSDRNK